jgi:hypothetical protein
MPLHVEILYNEYQFAAAFAASLWRCWPCNAIAKTYVVEGFRAARARRRRHQVQGIRKTFGLYWLSTTVPRLSTSQLIALLAPSGAKRPPCRASSPQERAV